MSTAYPAENLPNGYHSGEQAYANGDGHHMDGRQGDYPQPDQTSASQYTPGQDVKFNATESPAPDYNLNPASARSGSFPDYTIPRAQYPDGTQRYQASSGQTTNTGNMAQSSSPSMSLNDGHSNHPTEARNANSNGEIPVDPSIAASSPTYPHGHYPPYPEQHHMPQHYATPQGMYPRQDAYGPPYSTGHMPPYGPIPASVSTPTSMTAGTRPPGVGYTTGHHIYSTNPMQGGHPLSTVYSFVPIPGTHQQKRPRRRYEEIERMYKCGWNGCEKAYGTLNHLNAHVTMQSHGAKRTPEEFKEIRKEWKARRKEEDSARKADEERARQAQQSGQVDGQPPPQDGGQAVPGGYPQGGRQLPPIGYTPAGAQVSPQYAAPPYMQGMPEYQNGQMQSSYPPQSPYGQNNQMYDNRR